MCQQYAYICTEQWYPLSEYSLLLMDKSDNGWYMIEMMKDQDSLDHPARWTGWSHLVYIDILSLSKWLIF